MRSIRAVGLTRSLLTTPHGAQAAIAVVAARIAPAARFAAGRSISSTSGGKAPTEKLTFDQELTRLNEQRSLRPTSPHLSIYQPQLTWYGSIANRITGAGLSAALYAYAIGYAVLPLAGFGDIVSSTYLASVVAGLPFAVKIALKAPLAAAASYHTWNGFRHLAWDWGYLLSLKGAYTSGYTVIGLTTLSTIGLCML